MTNLTFYSKSIGTELTLKDGRLFLSGSPVTSITFKQYDPTVIICSENGHTILRDGITQIKCEEVTD